MKVVEEAAAMAVPEYPFSISDRMGTGSTDMGDLSSVMPVVHPYAGGTIGTGHGNDFYIADPVAACIGSAKMQLAMLLILLGDGGKRAQEIVANYKAPFPSKEAYLAYMDSLNTTGDRIEYIGEEAANVKL